MADFGEQFMKYMRYMSVLNMSREALDADPLAMETLLEIRDMVNADPDNEICEGLRPQVEGLLGPQHWAKGSES